MKAAWYTQAGEARHVLTVGELPTPTPGPGEVRVHLATSGVNPSDVKTRRRPPAFAEIIPHSDGAGHIDMVGDGVLPSRLAQRVWLWNGQWKRAMGTAAEYIIVPEAQAVVLPDQIDFAVGACLGIPLLTAVRAVQLLGDVNGKTVLVTGAASSVGNYVTQLAVMRGARVIGTVGSEEKQRHATAAGAFATIDYKQESVTERIKALTDGRGVDAVVDMDLATTVSYLRDDAIAPHGTVVCYGSTVTDNIVVPFVNFLYRSIDLRLFLVYELLAQDRVEALAEVDKLLRDGQLIHRIGARFSLDDIVAAHEAVETGKVMGNVVIDLA